MSEVKSRIQSAQEDYNSDCQEIDYDCDSRIEDINESRVTRKEESANRLVDKVLSGNK